MIVYTVKLALFIIGFVLGFIMGSGWNKTKQGKDIDCNGQHKFKIFRRKDGVLYSACRKCGKGKPMNQNVRAI